MSTETIVALVASCTSILVAAISVIVALITNFQTRKTTENVEKLKFHYSVDERTLNLRDENFQQSIAALQKTVQSIQKLKDNLQIILYDDSLSPSRVEEIIATCRADILSTYEEHMVHYSKKEAVIGHEAKNIALTVENILKKATRNEEGRIEKDSFGKVFELRNQLTEIQNLLRDSMVQKLSSRLGGVKKEDGK